MNVLIVSPSEELRAIILAALQHSFAPSVSQLFIVDTWAEAERFEHGDFAVAIIDIDNEIDYMHAVRSANFFYSCYTIVMTGRSFDQETVRELNQAGAANVLVAPTVDRVVAEFSDFKTKVWESRL